MRDLTREEELACLVAEQAEDDQWGHRVEAQGAPRHHRRISLDFAFEGGDSAEEIIGVPDAALGALLGDDEVLVRRLPRPQKWTRRQILSAIRKWAKEHGEPPTESEWRRPDGRGIPSPSSVRRRFSSWNAAIEAAGYDPRPRGGTHQPEELKATRLRRRIRRPKRTAYLTPEKVAAAYVLYDRNGLSLPELAARLWRSYGYRSQAACYTALHRAFHAEGFRLRTKLEAAQLIPIERRRERGRKGGRARWHGERAA